MMDEPDVRVWQSRALSWRDWYGHCPLRHRYGNPDQTQAAVAFAEDAYDLASQGGLEESQTRTQWRPRNVERPDHLRLDRSACEALLGGHGQVDPLPSARRQEQGAGQT